MTLRELYRQLDWSSVDAAHKTWEAEHVGEVLAVDPSALENLRLERLYYALLGLGIVGPPETQPDPRLWHTLPRPLRQQIVRILRANGLYAARTQDPD